MSGVPSLPPRTLPTGFLYFPPFRVQGYSIAGEESYVQIPELDVCFDVGRAPKLMLSSNFVALSHGHMDHAAGLAYYFSQRSFQGMGTGTVLCHPKLVEPIRKLMNAWIDIEAQRTPFEVVGMQPGTPTAEFEIKRHHYLRAFATDHTVPSLGFVVVEKRSKLQEQYVGLPQEKLVEIKASGKEITYIKEVPLIAYMGDTAPGKHFERDDVANAQVLITECTFMADDHRQRSRVGKHLHVADLAQIVEQVNCPNIVLTHLSRRTHLGEANRQLGRHINKRDRGRIHMLMDGRSNKERYRRQTEEAESQVRAASSSD